MAIEIFNRYESKYMLNENQFNIVNEIISKYMIKDKFNENNQKYLISNIYYDTKDNNLIRTSLQKPKYKEKIRLRSYGPKTDNEIVFLEIKKKFDGLVNKRRTKLTLAEAKEFIEYGSIPLKEYMNKQVVKEIEYFLKQNKVEPKVYLSYERLAFFGKDNNDLRVTIDTNIRTDRKNLYLNKMNIGENLLEEGYYLMEIKSAHAMPLWLTSLLSENKIYKTSFSKYGTEYNNYLKSINKDGYIKNINFNFNELKGGIYEFTY